MHVRAYKSIYYIVLGGSLVYLIYLIVQLYVLASGIDQGQLIIFPIFCTLLTVLLIAQILLAPCIMEVKLEDGDVSFLVHRYGLAYWTDPVLLDRYTYTLIDRRGDEADDFRKVYRFYLDDKYVGLLPNWHWVYVGTGLAGFLDMVRSYCVKEEG